ncbi:MAG: hypothetical protein CVT88_05235 [Candidatus Altiarchaeales archaeon HGW-Altiarchaeales-1]|nr:MAG: hypothetical protein CVT88_05235 [Candidatus Altiarchaeales archaeon HGW-Altiarchaeales-1]
MELKLKSMLIKNFKSLKDTKIELTDFNVLVGVNGSGKSNIVEVFRFLKHINQEGIINPFIKYGGYKNIVWKKNEELPVVFELTFENKKKETLSYELAISGFGDVFKLEKESIISTDFWLVNNGKDLIFEYKGQKISKEIKGMRKELFENRVLLSSSMVPWVFSSLVDLKSKDVDAIMNTIVSISDVILTPTHNFIPLNMKSPAKFESSERKFLRTSQEISSLNYDGSNLQMILYELFSKNKSEWPKEVTNRLKILFPDIENMVPIPTPEGKVMLEVVENGTNFIPQSLSDGFFKIMAILALSFGKTAHNILVIDEIENSLHPEAIEILIDALKSSKKQVIITTHSPIVLNVCKVEDILFVKKEVDETKVSRVENAEKLKKDLEKAGISTGEGWLYNVLE